MLSSYRNYNKLSQVNFIIFLDIEDKQLYISNNQETQFLAEKLERLAFSDPNIDLNYEYLNILDDEMKKLRNNYLEVYVQPDMLSEVLPFIEDIHHNYALIHSELENIWFAKQKESRLCLVNIKLSLNMDMMLTTVQPLEQMDFMAKKIRKLAEQQEFIRTHYYQFNKLTIREKEVIHLLACGLNNPKVAIRLNISRRTVEQHRKNINKKLRTNSFIQLLKYARAFDLV